MAKPLVSDELWGLIEPLIPKVPRRHRFPGRKRLDDRRLRIRYELRHDIHEAFLAIG